MLFASEASGSAVSVADWVSIGLTSVLVMITAVYVKLTRDMVTEMKNQRLGDVENRRREKSDRAAHQCLEAVGLLADEMARRGASAIQPEVLSIARRTLINDGSLIVDETIHDRVAACAEVLHVGAFPTEQMQREGLSPGLVALGVMEMLNATRSLLATYLAERDISFDVWARPDNDGCGTRLPGAGEAGAWIRCIGRGE